jgi:hypothetical protein
VQLDLVDYFNSIKVDKLKSALAINLERHFDTSVNGLSVITFAEKLIQFLLDNKFLQMHGRILQKVDSLSTGEKIATNAANILREVAFEPLVRRFQNSGFLELFAGYVDDVLAVIHPEETADVQHFIQCLNDRDPSQFKWTAKVSKESIDFLDLTITKKSGFKLNLKKRVEELLEKLRERIGQTFLSPCRIMICYPTRDRSNFMHSYAFRNFLLGQRTGRNLGRGG